MARPLIPPRTTVPTAPRSPRPSPPADQPKDAQCTPTPRLRFAIRIGIIAIASILALTCWFLSLSSLGHNLTQALHVVLTPVPEIVIMTLMDLPVIVAVMLMAIRFSRPRKDWRHPVEREFVSVGVTVFFSVLVTNAAVAILYSYRASLHSFVLGSTSGIVAFFAVVGGLVLWVGAVRVLTRGVMRLVDLAPPATPVSIAAVSAGRAAGAARRAAPADVELVEEYGDHAVADIRDTLPEGASTDEMRDLLERTRGNYTNLTREHRARHEAEHAVVAYFVGAVVISADIHQHGQVGGTTERRFTDESPELLLRSTLRICVAPIASAMAAGDLDGHTGDLHKAILAAQSLRLLLGPNAGTSDEHIDEAMTHAVQILEKNRPAVDAITLELIDRDRLLGRDIARIIRETAQQHVHS